MRDGEEEVEEREAGCGQRGLAGGLGEGVLTSPHCSPCGCWQLRGGESAILSNIRAGPVLHTLMPCLGVCSRAGPRGAGYGPGAPASCEQMHWNVRGEGARADSEHSVRPSVRPSPRNWVLPVGDPFPG